MNDDQRSKTVDPLASQRAALLGKLGGAASALEMAIADLARSGADTSAADGQLARLAALQASIGTAGPTDLRLLAASVAAVIGQAQSIAQDARSQAASADAASARTLTDARKAARETIAALEDDLYKRKIFDPYLRFKSAEDEQAYREREEQNRRAIEAARAKGTPEGELEALAIEKRQLVDAGAHGADKSPEWGKRMSQYEEAYSNLVSAMQETGPKTGTAKTEEMENARTFLKTKGLSDADIERAVGQGQSVASMIEPYLSSVTDKQAAPVVEKTKDIHLQEVAAALSAAGVLPTSATISEGHGVNVAIATPSSAVRNL